MKQGRIVTEESRIRDILANSGAVAVIGLSPKPERDSYRVAKYLKEHGYRIIPVRPAQEKILGEKVYASIDDIEEPVDIVNLFRRSDQIMPHAIEALRLTPKVFWMQTGIENHEAAKLLTAAGIDVVMNLCIMTAHDRLCK